MSIFSKQHGMNIVGRAADYPFHAAFPGRGYRGAQVHPQGVALPAGLAFLSPSGMSLCFSG